jgi:uncharacterized protein YbcV (DUF1398 family)
MNAEMTAIAQTALTAAYEGTLDFPKIVRMLLEAGFEGYSVDYRRGTTIYFLPSGDSIELAMPETTGSVAPEFKASVIESAVRDAQTNAPGYTYVSFCARVKAAGCAGYMVSFPGRRVAYFGRTAELHVEHFPS